MDEPKTSIYVVLDGVTIGAIKTVHVEEGGLTLNAHPMRILCTHVGNLFKTQAVHPAAQQRPFDVMIEDVFKHATIRTTISNVWIDSIDSIYSGEDFVVLSKVKGKADSITSILKRA